MRSFHVWAITADLTHPVFPPCTITEYYAAESYEAAKAAFVEARGEWTITHCHGRCVTVWDATKDGVIS